MTLLLIIPAWIALLGLVVALCTAARVGDKLESRQPGSAASRPFPRPRAEDRASLSRPAGRVQTRNLAA